MSAARIIRRSTDRAELAAKAKLNRRASTRVGYYWTRYQECLRDKDPRIQQRAKRYLELYQIGMKGRRGKH